MNLFDIIILAVLILFALKGLVRGLINEASSLTGLILGGWLAYRFYPGLAAPIRSTLHVPEHVSAFLAFMLLLLVTGIVAHIAGNILTAALKLVMLGSLNRLGGILIGAAEGVLLLCLLFSTATAGFMPDTLKHKVRASESANMFAETGDRILSLWRNSTRSRP
ncbi:MAG: CvpA family protein [Desulfuromonadales bacterium]|nr:CvpA family protein [Desulfuromonadales bacterium]